MNKTNESNPNNTPNVIMPDTGNDYTNNNSKEGGNNKKDNSKSKKSIKDFIEIKESDLSKNSSLFSKDNNPDKRRKKGFLKKLIKRFFIFFLIGTIVSFIFQPMIESTIEMAKITSISYTEAIEKINNGDISEGILVTSTQTVYLYETIKEADGTEVEKGYCTGIPDMQIFTELTANNKNLKLEVTNQDPFTKKIVSSWEIVPVILGITCILFFFFAFRSYKKHLDNTFNPTNISEAFKGPKEDIKPVNTNKYTFADVAGIDQERWEVEEVVDMLKNPEKYRSTGAKVPKGILLSGKPGTGKTLIAKAIAGEAGVNFFSCSGSSFDNMFVGVGASKVRELFDTARRNAPAIIFIDEIDSVAKKRFTFSSSNEQTLNQLLSEMDGFNEIDNIIFIAATNHIEALDPAITRPGRFDRIINIPLPDRKGRYEILLVHSKNKVFENNKEKEKILLNLARKTSGMSGATLENILNEASIVAIRNKRTFINSEDVDEAFVKIILGISKHDKEVSNNAKELTAYHEAGHAIIGRIKRPERKVLQVSIVPRGTAGGYTLFEDAEETTFPTKEDFYNSILVSLGGRAAEKFKYGTISVGASSDLEHANTTAHEMIYSYAMVNSSQLVRLYDERDYNQMLEKDMYSEMKDVLDKAYEEACEIINNNSKLLEALAKILIEYKSTLNADELEYVFKQFGV